MYVCMYASGVLWKLLRYLLRLLHYMIALLAACVQAECLKVDEHEHKSCVISNIVCVVCEKVCVCVCVNKWCFFWCQSDKLSS
jgi:hypothetical protein